MPKLVVVESPAKAKTISRFLDAKEYNVQASFGHVRDLPEKADEIPQEFKKFKWANLGVNVEQNYEPIYVVPDSKKRYIATLKDGLKKADELLLATDEDREGESISWHVLEVLKPKKDIKIKRIVFHEITPEAIKEAIAHPRDLDINLVKAQEARRILDRLYGYTLSPVLWKKIAPKLSAGRVQSVAVRAIVERERERQKFKSSEYWDLSALLKADKDRFNAKLFRIDQNRLANGSHFDPQTGEIKAKDVIYLNGEDAKALLTATKEAKPWVVSKVETKPEKQNQPAPFMTSSLQQEASRKYRYPAKKTMQIAQTLYEGIDLAGERIGLITYMRTDSLTLSQRALNEAREVIEKLYGKEYLPEKPVQYKTKSKNAQEAHEAIRPTDLSRRPQDVKQYLTQEQFNLYELIWKRTIACQMLPAKVLKTSVEIEVTSQNKKLGFSTSGKTIEFPGYLKAYVEGSDDPESELEDKETLLPPLKIGQEVVLEDLKALEHNTRPPARFTEATLIKYLVDSGIGRPSTYATIISTIQDREYVRKKGNELIPTFRGVAVTVLLEDYFGEWVDMKFTAKMEDELDDIANGKYDYVKYLSQFYQGDTKKPGLQPQVTEITPTIPFPAIPIGVDSETNQSIHIKVGRSGAYLQRGDGGKGNVMYLSEDIAPADLTLEQAKKMFSESGPLIQEVCKDPKTGRAVYYKTGPYGGYFEVEQSDAEKSAGDKPKRVGLPDKLSLSDLSEEEIQGLLSLPKNLGRDPESDKDVIVASGPYGSYIQCGLARLRYPDWRAAINLNLENALQLLASERAKPTTKSGRRVPEPIKSFGTLEGQDGEIKLFSGPYGHYVSDGKINASVPKSVEIDDLTAEQALALLKEKAANPTKAKPNKTAKRTTRTKK
jgi:DNA topoisomerase-1